MRIIQSGDLKLDVVRDFIVSHAGHERGSPTFVRRAITDHFLWRGYSIADNSLEDDWRCGML